MITPITQKDGLILDILQRGLPLARRPFRILSAEADIGEDDVLESINRMTQSGILRRIGGSFDPKRLGLYSTLCGCEIETGHLENAAGIVSRFPEVTHNYGRDAEINLWFTVIARSCERIGTIIGQTERIHGVRRVLNLPMKRRFKLSVYFSMSGETAAADCSANRLHMQPYRPDKTARSVISALQRGRQAVRDFYGVLADELALNTEELLHILAEMKNAGVLRKIGGFVNHTVSIYRANAMVVYDIDESDMEQAAAVLSQKPFVSHCYHRERYPQWPYTLYAMMHDTDSAGLGEKVRLLSQSIPAKSERMLYTVSEYKKKPWIMDELYEDNE
ncbi:MAG: hypothetical protein ACOC2H_04120 [Spirochaetota bacterium]